MLKSSFKKDLYSKKKSDPCIIVIFGASGDLAKRKLIPSFFKLYMNELLPDNFIITGFARTPMSRENYIDNLKSFYKYDKIYSCFFNKIDYFHGNYDNKNDYTNFKKFLIEMEKKHNIPGNRLFYLSTPPELSETITKMLSDQKLISKNKQKKTWRRVVFEKPFGHDLKSASNLNTHLNSLINEDQIYRIDHYLGKETVQNIAILRFTNSLFEPIFNRNFIDHIQMTVSESLGVENRAGYFDKTGILKDMIQNHMLQLLSLITMEPPASLTSEKIHAEKLKIFRAIRKYSGKDAIKNSVRAQYNEGIIGTEFASAFNNEKGVSRNSITETYAAIKLFIENSRWEGVPFCLRAGKRLSKKNSEIVISFKKPCCKLFKGTPIKDVAGNILVIHVQPYEGITFKINAKTPGFKMDLTSVNMDFLYGKSFGKKNIDAYERLLQDALMGDSTLYATGKEVIESWKFVTPILKAWEDQNLTKLSSYRSGSDGPKEADTLIENDGFKWRRI